MIDGGGSQISTNPVIYWNQSLSSQSNNYKDPSLAISSTQNFSLIRSFGSTTTTLVNWPTTNTLKEMQREWGEQEKA